MRGVILIGLLLSACTTPGPVRVQTVNVPVPTLCPATADLPAKPAKPALPEGVEAALRVAVAHAARLSAWGDDLAGRLEACRTVK